MKPDWTLEFPHWQESDRAKWRKEFPNGPDYDHAVGVLLYVAHELALASVINAAPLYKARYSLLADKLMHANAELQLATQRPRPIQVVAPAPRTICLRCGEPYEGVEDAP